MVSGRLQLRQMNYLPNGFRLEFILYGIDVEIRSRTSYAVDINFDDLLYFIWCMCVHVGVCYC